MAPRDPRITQPAEVTVSAALVPQADQNLTAFIEPFLAEKCNISDSSVRAYRGGLCRFLTWLQGEKVLSPTRNTIIAYRREMASQGLSGSSISAYLVVVRLFFTWLESMKIFPNVAKGVSGAKAARGFKRDCLTRDQAVDLLASIDRSTLIGKRDFALLSLLIRTGLRTCEVMRADIADIRQEGGEAKLWVRSKGRDAKDDWVLLTEAALKPLRLYLAARGPVEENAPVFISLSDRTFGGRLVTRSIRGIVKSRLRSIGLDSNRLSAHSMRHTAITFSLRGGATVQQAQALARHSSISSTMIYAHLVDRFDQAAERKVDAYLDHAEGARVSL